MANFDMWAWYGQGLLPQVGANDLNASYDGQVWSAGADFDYANYGNMQMVDANDDGILSDNDTGDGSSAGGDGLILPDGSFTTINEVALYNDTVLTYLDFDGVEQTWTATLSVWQTSTGDAVFRLNNSLNATWPEDFFPGNIVSIEMGTWDGVEYSAGTVSGHLDEPPVPCFAAGTMIRTARGDIAVETLQVGDQVLTADHGMQPIRWIGQRSVSRGLMAVYPQFRPIRIRAGALGPMVPDADLVVSPQHRILVRSAIARRMFGTDEVLVAAKHLGALEGVEAVVDAQQVTYVHLLFDRHEVVIANGTQTESLFVGKGTLHALDDAAQHEVLSLFPELAGGVSGRDRGARPLVAGRQGRKLAQRHAQHHRSVQAVAEPA